MSQDWADRIAEQLLSRGLIQTGICLILGAVDTGQITTKQAKLPPQGQFSKYFRDSYLYNISLGAVAVQPSRNLGRQGLVNRLVALRDEKGVDIAIGLIMGW